MVSPDTIRRTAMTLITYAYVYDERRGDRRACSAYFYLLVSTALLCDSETHFDSLNFQ